MNTYNVPTVGDIVPTTFNAFEGVVVSGGMYDICVGVKVSYPSWPLPSGNFCGSWSGQAHIEVKTLEYETPLDQFYGYWDKE
jgi:hypothetical protein